VKDDPAIPTTAPALHLFPAALQPTAPADVALALRELPPPPLLPLSLNPAPASRASANASSPPTPDDTENTHKTQKHKKKSSATKLRPPLQTPNLKKNNLKHFHKTNPTHKTTKTQKEKTQKQKLPANSKSRSHPQATVYTGTKLATNTTMQSSSESHPLELTTEKLSESNPAAKAGA
jgi:hypothetical protein